DLSNSSACTDQGYAAARNNAFFDCGACCMQSIFNACFLFFHFDFGSSTDANHSNTAGQLGNAFLQFFAIVVGSSFFDLNADLLNARFDRFAVASAVDDRGVFFSHFDALGLAQLFERSFFKRHASFFGDNSAAGQDGDVFQHGFAAIAETRCLDSSCLEDTADVIDNQRSQGFAFDIFSNDQQRAAGLGNLFQDRKQVADVADFLVENQDIRIFQDGNLLVWVVDEVRRQVAAVELHAFDDVEFVFQRFAVFNGNNAFFADLVHCVGNDFTD